MPYIFVHKLPFVKAKVRWTGKDGRSGTGIRSFLKLLISVFGDQTAAEAELGSTTDLLALVQ